MSDEYTCPMPTLRLWWGSEDEPSPRLELCGEVIDLHTRGFHTISEETWDAVNGDDWRVECRGGHVLLVPDDESNGDLDRLQPNGGVLRAVLLALGCREREYPMGYGKNGAGSPWPVPVEEEK